MKKLFAVILALAALSLSACAGNIESSQAEQSTIQTDESTISSTFDETSEITNAEEKEFDFDEAVKSFTLFGEKFSLPCSPNDISGDFSLESKSEWMTVENIVSSGIYYKGAEIGMVMTTEDNQEQITTLVLGGFFTNEILKDNEELRKTYFDQLGWYSGIIKMDLCGLNFSLSADEVKKLLGEPVKTTEEYYKDRLVYEYPNGKLMIKFDGDEINEIWIDIYVSCSDKISEIANVEDNNFDKFTIKPAITMDGQYISMPCNVKNITGIRIDTEYSFAVIPETENVKEYSTAYFYYNNIRAGLIT